MVIESIGLLNIVLRNSPVSMDHFHYCPVCGSPSFEPASFKSRRCSCCGFELFQNPAASVAAFIRDGEGRLLMAVRSCEPQKGTLDLPGGFADMGESAEEAVRREILEETALHVDDLRYLFSIPNVYEYSGMKIPTLDMFFECSVSDLSPLRPADDVEALVWMHPDDIDADSIGLDSIRRAFWKQFRTPSDNGCS